MKYLLSLVMFALSCNAIASSSKCTSTQAYNVMKASVGEVAQNDNFKSYTIPKTDWLGSSTYPDPVMVFPISFVDQYGDKKIGYVRVDATTCEAGPIDYDKSVDF